MAQWDYARYLRGSTRLARVALLGQYAVSHLVELRRTGTRTGSPIGMPNSVLSLRDVLLQKGAQVDTTAGPRTQLAIISCCLQKAERKT